jgi:2-amino-4-hydroxy-6-hydroxymethyldihydropteridine diphosphokinase
MARCLLALGSNLGDRHANLSQACAQITQLVQCRLLARSHWYSTIPIGGAAGQGEFLNGAVLLETALSPHELALQLQQIETQLGRQRVVRWDARTIDIDLLLYGAEIVETATLILPHPRMSFRRFVLEPAAEIAGWMVHPTSGWTLSRLLGHLLESPRFVIVASDDAAIAHRLVSHLALRWKCLVWSGAEEILASGCGLSDTGSVEFPAGRADGPPIIAQLTPQTLASCTQVLLAGKARRCPALVIAVDSVGTHKHPTFACRTVGLSLGPVARITTNEPAVITQEAEAAMSCVWPDLR